MKPQLIKKKTVELRPFNHNHLFFIFCVLLFWCQIGYSQTLSSINTLQNNFPLTSDSRIKSAFDKRKPFKILSEGFNGEQTTTKDASKVTNHAYTIEIEKQNWEKAAEYAQDNATKLKSYLTTISTYPDLIPLDINSKDEDVRNVYYIILAAQKKKDLTNYFADKKIDSARDQRDIQVFIDAINIAVKSITNPKISVFASGDIVGSISNQGAQGTGQSTIATGSLGMRYETNKDIVSAKISVASTQDTLKNNFAQSLLVPAKGKALGSALIEWYHNINCSKLGSPWLHFYGSVASSLWDMDSTNPSLTRPVSSFGMGSLLQWRIFNGEIANTSAGLTLEIGGSLRYYGGDVLSLLKSGSDSATFIKAFPTKRNLFIGPEAGMTLNLGEVTAALQVYHLFGKKNEPINGLTRLQFSFGISINASIISGILN